MNDKNTHTCPYKSSPYLSTLSLLVQSAGPQWKGRSMKTLFQVHPPKFQLSMAQGTKAVLTRVRHKLFFHVVVKIGLLMPRSLFSHISNPNTKWKVQDRGWGAQGHSFKWQQEHWERSEKDRNRNKFVVWPCAILWLSNVRISSCLQIPRLSKTTCSNIVISEKYYFHQAYIYIFSSWVPSL